MLLNQHSANYSAHRTDKIGCTPFYLAVQEGHVEVVKRLLSVEGVDVNAGQVRKITPLIIAAINGYVDIVQVGPTNYIPKNDIVLSLVLILP